jgi:preprotein translocase subunit SecE
MATDDASAQANRSGMDPKRLVVIFYLLATLILGLFLKQIVSMAMAQIGWSDRVIVPGTDWQLSTVLGFLLSLGIAVGTWIHPRSHTLALECASELMKVTWPSWAETRVSTMAVIGASVIAAGALFVIDQGAYHLMVEWLPKLMPK